MAEAIADREIKRLSDPRRTWINRFNNNKIYLMAAIDISGEPVICF
jgi:hypothetical protein